jgi:proteasome lid subunit RPN8/RPN11
MTATPVLQAPTLRAVCALAEASPDREVCGFVVEGPGPGGQELVPARNAAAAPAREFRIAPREVLAVLRGAEDAGRALVALYHSHPEGGAGLSARDIAELVVDGQPTLPGVLLLVVTLVRGRAKEARTYAWRGSGYAEAARHAAPFTL